MLYKYTLISHPETEAFYNSIKDVFRKLWKNRNSIQNFSLTTLLFTQDQITILRRSPKFSELLGNFVTTWLALDEKDKRLVIRAFICENDVARRLNNAATQIFCKNDLHESIREPVKNLFFYLYDEQFRKNYLNDYYPIFYGAHRHRYCPFCGLEKIPSPSSIKKKEYDHILPKSIYPFASVNIKNLAPACSACNEDAKKSKDILYVENEEGAKQRRVYDYIYDQNQVNVEIRLEPDTVFPDSSGNNSSWNLSILPSEDKTIAWDDTFCVKQRYVEVLEQYYNEWLSEIIGYCSDNNSRTQEMIAVSIRTYASFIRFASDDDIKSKLKRKFYEFVASSTKSIPFITIQSALN